MKKNMCGLYAPALSLCLGLSLGLDTAKACDLHAIENDLSTEKPIPGAVRFSVAEQFTYFGKVQEDSRVYSDPANQHMASSITQFVTAYDATERVSIQVNLPYISRHFRRFEDGAIDSGVEAGIGDLSLLGQFVALDTRGDDWTVIGRVYGGVKLPTGDTDRLAEESDHHSKLALRHGDAGHDDHSPGDGHGGDSPHGGGGDHDGDSDHGTDPEPFDPISTVGDGDDDDHHHHDDEIVHAVHGHDLALGSGSVDFPVGFALLGQYDSFFVRTDVQYLIRTEGDYDYTYADDLQWSFAPGAYLMSAESTTVSFAVDLSGEYKREDSRGGKELDDTARRSIFIGPELRISHGKWRGSLAWDKPIDINNSGVQAVVSDRVRASVSYWF